MLIRRAVTIATTIAVMTAAPAVARADWLLTPFLGVSFGGDATSEHVAYGGSVAWMGAGIVGFELDGSYLPGVFNSRDSQPRARDGNVSTMMFNLIVGAPLGAPGVRPYVSGGGGLLRTNVDDAGDLFDIDDDSFGVNVGAGIIGFVRENFGVRGDVRYFRNVRDSNLGNDIDLDLGSFDFWRASVGATFRF